jgi:HNH endonuclease
MSVSVNECIYSQEGTSHESVWSKAHCFPDAMGGMSYTTDKVCKTCNNQINNQVENHVIQSLSFFQNIWGIESRRNKIPRIQATLRFAGLEEVVSLDEKGQPARAIVRSETNSEAKKYLVFGPADKVEEKKIEIQEKFPGMQWVEHVQNEMRMFEPPKSMVKIELDLAGNRFRRLAAKVAFERFSQIRPAAILRGEEFDHIREFIRDGQEVYLCCGLLSDIRLLKGSLDFPIPNHGVVLIAHPSDPILGAFVTFYGLFTYWVLLSKRYTALMPFDDLLLEHPQQGTVGNPTSRQGTGSLRVKWTEIIAMYEGREKEAVRIVRDYATGKMKAAIDEYNSR